jgi:hypothetical protein
MSEDRTISTDSHDRAQSDAYDPHIVPAETAARKEREGSQFKTVPTEEREASAATDDQTDSDSLETTGGYTVDQEGLLNNYAIEPEMYYEVPGDARQAEEEHHQERVEEYREINQDEEGKLTTEHDQRGRGTGAV